MSSNWPEPETDNLDSLEIDPEFIREANQFSNQVRTVPTGEYQIQGNSFEWEVDSRDPGQYKRAVPGRKYGRVRFDVYRDGKKAATVFADISPVAHKIQARDGRSFLDTPSQLFGQIAKAFGVKTVGEVRDGLPKYRLMGYIREQFRTADKQYVTPRTEAERVELIEKGATPYLDLRSIKAVS